MRKKTRWLCAGAGALAALLIVPAAVAGYVHHRDQVRRTKVADFFRNPNAGDEGWHESLDSREEDEGAPGEPEHDDARRRAIMDRVKWGPQTRASSSRLAKIAFSESRRWSSQMPAPVSPLSPTLPSRSSVLPASPLLLSSASTVTGESWVNLGPADASFEWNGTSYTTVDSGRPNSIVVNPVDPSIVYLATSAGGLWKTYNFVSGSPTWEPITETLGALAIGAMDLDPQNPDTLFVGTGDFIDSGSANSSWTNVAIGGQVYKSIDGGGSWGAPVSLTGTYPTSAGSLAVQAVAVRDLKVDPSNSNIVLVGTDVGLFRSTDGGASFSLVDLPNSSTQVAESVWSVVYTGSVNGTSHWAVSGVYACAQGKLPPAPAYGVPAGSSCTLGNPGDVWTSSDAGASWSSRTAAGALPTVSGGVGRISMGAGDTSNPASTVIYAQLGNENEGSSAGAGYWRSNNAGASWVQINGSLSNPTKRPPGGSQDCGSTDVASQQAYYNQAIAVDPSNANHVIVGGMLCGLRTLNGLSSTPTWENISHWLPSGGGGNVSGGTLPYVHADWHAARVLRTSTGYVVFAGTDGGLFSSTNLFDSTVTPPNVVWDEDNRGLVTHLMYSVASGDPATGNPYVAFGGLQDNGTRFRDTATSNSTVFNQVIGGDGIGAVANTSSGGSTVYWASTEYHNHYCVPSSSNNNCNQGGAWTRHDLTPQTGCSYNGSSDAIPFLVYYASAPASTTANTVLTNSENNIFRVTGTGTWTRITNCISGFTRGVVASPVIDGLYGAPLSGGRFYVTNGCTANLTGCTWTTSSPLGYDLNGDGTIASNEKVLFTSSLSFPPTTPTGKTPGDVFVAASSAVLTSDGVTFAPSGLGHLFITNDRGSTWTPLHGNGTGYDLPNVGVHVVRYDPGDTTNNTIWVGTQLGIYRTTDGGQTWQRYGEGLPLVSVTDLFISQSGGLLRASTYGRGLWEIYPSATSDKGVNGDGDFDRNLQLDGFDLGALASRLGTDPSTATQPYYDWNLDLTGSVNATDSNDLSAFLSRFGGHP